MDKNEFKTMVEKYKSELMKMAGLTVKAQEVNNPSLEENNSQVDNSTMINNTERIQPQTNELQSDVNQGADPLPFEQGAPYTGKAAGDDSLQETYQEFLDQNKEYGLLKVQAFAARQAIPISGVQVIVSKRFSDMDKIFFEGRTDESGIIDNIKLPTTSKLLSERPQDVLPYAEYDFSAFHEIFNTESANNIQIFQDIKSIQPVRVVPRG